MINAKQTIGQVAVQSPQPVKCFDHSVFNTGVTGSRRSIQHQKQQAFRSLNC